MRKYLVWIILLGLVLGAIIAFSNRKMPNAIEPKPIVKPSTHLDCSDLKNYNECYGNKDNGKGA